MKRVAMQFGWIVIVLSLNAGMLKFFDVPALGRREVLGLLLANFWLVAAGFEAIWEHTNER